MAIQHFIDKKEVQSRYRENIAYERQARRSYREMAQDGSRLERITLAHPDQKLAEVAQAFEAMLRQPLCKKFLRSKPRLYLIKDPTLIAGPEDWFLTRNNKIIHMAKSAADLLSVPELNAIIAHEIGHILATDQDFRRVSETIDTEREDLADQIGLFLSKDPDAFKAALRKICEAGRQEYIRNEDKAGLAKHEEFAAQGSLTYRSLEGRIAEIDSTVKYIEKGEPFGLIEDKLAKELSSRHWELFSHHRRPDPAHPIR